MTFNSILSERPDIAYAPNAPDCFVDLNLDQIVTNVATGYDKYELKPFFQTPLTSVDAINYRHEIFQDLEDDTLFRHITSFAETMRSMRERLTQVGKLHYRQQKQAWFMHAAEYYCNAVKGFEANLAHADLRSRGLAAFRAYFADYAASDYFTALVEETDALKADLAAVRYCVLIKDNAFTVRDYESEIDYSADVEATFEKFKQGAATDYKVKYRSTPEMNHIEAKILEFVALLNPALFARLDDYCARHADFIDKTIERFDREIHFYIAYLATMAKLNHVGLQFCYPLVSAKSKEISVENGFDLALAQKLAADNAAPVCNGFSLTDKERIIVVSGPNQGGKTTFSRMFGQLHYLASIGCPVPSRNARLFLFDRILTHFEKQEKVENLRGKLEDDLVRVHDIVRLATPRSILITNEIFTSTTLQDEVFLSRKVMNRIIDLDLLCVWVTFVDELASLSEQTVSMVSSIDPENPAVRTFKLVRRRADGLAYAMAIAEKYRLTYRSIKERVTA